MDAAAVAAILRSVRATAEADPAGALPTLIATVGVVVAPLQAFGASSAELGGSGGTGGGGGGGGGGGFSDACALDALAILAVLRARREGRAAAQRHVRLVAEAEAHDEEHHGGVRRHSRSRTLRRAPIARPRYR